MHCTPSSCVLANFVYCFEGAECKIFDNRECGGKKDGNEIIQRLDAEKVYQGQQTEWETFELVVRSHLGETPILAAVPDKDSLYLFCGDRGYMVDVNLKLANKCHDYE